MELTDILIDLSNSKAALEVANHTIRRMKGKVHPEEHSHRWPAVVRLCFLQDGERSRKAAQGSR